jgi:hypothetical protein
MRGLVIGVPISCLLWLLIFAAARNLSRTPDDTLAGGPQPATQQALRD